MGINGLIVFQIIYPALRWLAWFAVLLYVVVALAVLGARYALFPNADNYKPYVTAQLSSLLGSSVEVGHIAAKWHGLNPRIEMDQIALHDSDGSAVLTVPRLVAVVSWRSLFTLTPQFVSVHAAGVDLSVRRDQQRQLWLLGRAVSDTKPGKTSEPIGEKAVSWLVSQSQIQLHDSVIRWTDETRDARPLVLQDVTLKVRNRAQRHQFSLTARPEAQVGGRFDMRGHLLRSTDPDRPLALETGTGQLYLHIDDMHPTAWEPWLDWPEFLDARRVSAQAWLDTAHGKALGVTVDLRMHDAVWRASDTQIMRSQSGRFHVQGPWQTFQDVLFGDSRSGTQTLSLPVQQTADVADASADALELWLDLHKTKLELHEHYDDPIDVERLNAGGTVANTQGEWSLQLDDLVLQNKDVSLKGAVNWTSVAGTKAGYVDAHAYVHRVELAAVHRYMPLWISSEVRDWLQDGLLAGQVYDARLDLRGDLSQFPFDVPGSEGIFHLRGPYRDAVIDYAPSDDVSRWPRLDDVQGRIDLNRSSLRIQASSARIFPENSARIDLEDIDAFIPDLQNDATLHVTGNTSADGGSYMAFIRRSALSDILNGIFDQAVADGGWSLPLSLTLPLTRLDDTSVNGTIQIENGALQIEPQYPRFTHVNGSIPFTEDTVVAETVSARLLNENVSITGGVGPGLDGLHMAGQIDAKSLQDLFDVPAMARIVGKMRYKATLTGISQGSGTANPVFSVTSDLQGMELNFPAPLDKSADTAWPLQVTWSYDNDPGTRWLDVTLADNMHARFVHVDKSSSTSYFQAGFLGVGREAQWHDSGLTVDIVHPAFDGDAWNAILREFETPDESPDGQRILPKVQSLRLQAGTARLLGLRLDDMTYTVKQQAPNEWRADISSTQTAGTLTWTEDNNRIQGPVQAVFHRLAYGGDPQAGSESSSEELSDEIARSIGDDVSIPAINLIIENLRLYGRDVGKLALVGVNEARGDTWRLEQFMLSSPSAYLEGEGVWRLRGADRGLTLNAQVDVSDLGDYADQIGFKDMLSAGEGTVQGQIYWEDFPWSFDLANVDGQISFEFAKGRLSTVNSKSARLLELISFQSIRRVAKLDLNPLSVTKDGFPYDVLRGVLKLEHGKVYTEDYRIVGPVGTIVLDGLVFLSSGKLDLQAVVVPNLDVSGAAIAAGVAINPVVGIGAFLTQWLLKAPLAQAMTAQYKILGDWEQPEIQAVERIRTDVKE